MKKFDGNLWKWLLENVIGKLLPATTGAADGDVPVYRNGSIGWEAQSGGGSYLPTAGGTMDAGATILVPATSTSPAQSSSIAGDNIVVASTTESEGSSSVQQSTLAAGNVSATQTATNSGGTTAYSGSLGATTLNFSGTNTPADSSPATGYTASISVGDGNMTFSASGSGATSQFAFNGRVSGSEPSGATDFATKNYVDNATSGASGKIKMLAVDFDGTNNTRNITNFNSILASAFGSTLPQSLRFTAMELQSAHTREFIPITLDTGVVTSANGTIPSINAGSLSSADGISVMWNRATDTDSLNLSLMGSLMNMSYRVYIEAIDPVAVVN